MTDPTSVKAQAYDCVLNGIEIGGGSIRIHDSELQADMFKALGIDEEEAQAKFGFLMDALQYGRHRMVAGLGVDRILMLLCETSSIRDVIAFPKTQKQTDLMLDAPSQIDFEQLHELHIKTMAVKPADKLHRLRADRGLPRAKSECAETGGLLRENGLEDFCHRKSKGGWGPCCGQVGRLYATVSSSLGSTTVRFTGHQGHAIKLTRKALREGYERIAWWAGMGRSTRSSMGSLTKRVRASILRRYLPLFLPAPVVTLPEVSACAGKPRGCFSNRHDPSGRHRRCSLVAEHHRHFINIASFGSTGLVIDRVNKASKTISARQGELFFRELRGPLAVQKPKVRLRVDDHFDEVMSVNCVAVASGRYFGGSMKVAPKAVLDDGLFDVVMIADMSALEFVRHNKRIYSVPTLNWTEISLVRGSRWSLSRWAMARCVECDGERPGDLPATLISYRSLLSSGPHRAARWVNH